MPNEENVISISGDSSTLMGIILMAKAVSAVATISGQMVGVFSEKQRQENKNELGIKLKYVNLLDINKYITSITAQQLEEVTAAYKNENYWRKIRNYLCETSSDESCAIQNTANFSITNERRAELVRDYMLKPENHQLGFCKFLWLNYLEERLNFVNYPKKEARIDQASSAAIISAANPLPTVANLVTHSLVCAKPPITPSPGSDGQDAEVKQDIQSQVTLPVKQEIRPRSCG